MRNVFKNPMIHFLNLAIMVAEMTEVPIVGAELAIGAERRRRIATNTKFTGRQRYLASGAGTRISGAGDIMATELVAEVLGASVLASLLKTLSQPL